LNGIFLNMKGREKYGIVNNGNEAEKLKIDKNHAAIIKGAYEDIERFVLRRSKK